MKRLEGLANGLKTSETPQNTKGRNQVFGVGGVHNRYEGEVSHNNAEWEVEVRWRGYNKAGESLTNWLFCSLWAGGSWLVTSRKKDNDGNEWDNENDLVCEPLTVLKIKAVPNHFNRSHHLSSAPIPPVPSINQNRSIPGCTELMWARQTVKDCCETMVHFPQNHHISKMFFYSSSGMFEFCSVERCTVCAESLTVFTLRTEGDNILSADLERWSLRAWFVTSQRVQYPASTRKENYDTPSHNSILMNVLKAQFVKFDEWSCVHMSKAPWNDDDVTMCKTWVFLAPGGRAA